MCGICGYVKLNRDSNYINRKYILDMCSVLSHRGPDGEGIWQAADNQVGLGHRRLSIIDLSTNASQPMTNEDGNIVIAFNGEIYNHEELKQEIIKHGKYKHCWKTDHSDTEVIIHAYEEWGIGFLEKLRGMYAIALYDNFQKKMWLIRDKIGIKPLYYAEDKGIVTFASEIKSIVKVYDKKLRINERALYDYLSFLTTPCEQTLFDGIKKLRPGTYICIDENGNIIEKKYYDVLDNTRPDMYSASENEIREEVLRELKIAVNYRKESDVPVGVFLSGGIDSSTNAALFSSNSESNVKTFCVGYPQEMSSYTSEFTYADKVAKQIGTEHHTYEISQSDAMDVLKQMIYQQDEPIADPVCIPLYYVSNLARNNDIIVAQVGEGADELFWGYSSWNLRWKISKHVQQHDYSKIAKMMCKCGRVLDKKLYYEWMMRISKGQPVFWGGTEAYTDARKRELLSEEMNKRFDGYTSFESIKQTYDNYKEKSWDNSAINWMGYCDLNHRLPELLLMRVDKMSMWNSLECRVPFLDHKVVELALSIPERMKCANNENKHILKEAVKGIIPDEIIYRRKQGFGAPVLDWFKGDMGKDMRSSILRFVEETSLFNVDYIRKHIQEEPEWNDWYLYNLALWWETFIK